MKPPMPPEPCPYCGDRPVLMRYGELTASSATYPYGSDYGPVWVCSGCTARVGCHQGTTKPLGSLADQSLREARKRAHAAFDPLWKGGGVPRTAAYAWLSERLRVPPRECHISWFDVTACAEVVAIMAAADPLEVRQWAKAQAAP